jgi:CHAD domain-containing protein
MADSFRAIDPDKNWKKMRRQATTLFDRLGALRDCHVMMEWVEKLGQDNDPVTHDLTAYLQEQESSIKHQAQAAIEVFDHKQWDQWTQSLPRRTLRLPLNSEVFQALALERFTASRRLQAQALKTGSDAALHRLRIAIKKFRSHSA